MTSMRSQQSSQCFQQFVERQTKKIKAILVEKSRVADEFFTQKENLPLPSSIFRHGGVLGEKYCVAVPSAVIIPTVPPSESRDQEPEEGYISHHRRVHVDPKLLFKEIIRQRIDPASAIFVPDQAIGDRQQTRLRTLGKEAPEGDISSPVPVHSQGNPKTKPPSPSAASDVGSSISGSIMASSVRSSPGAGSVDAQRLIPGRGRLLNSMQPSMVAGNKVASKLSASAPISSSRSPARPAPRPSVASSVASDALTGSGSISGRKPLAYGGTNGSTKDIKPKFTSKQHTDKLTHTRLTTVDEDHSMRTEDFDEEQLLLESLDIDGGNSVRSTQSRIVVPLSTLRKITAQYPQLSMRSIADRKISQLISRRITNYEENLQEFRNSNILAKSEAESIYFCLPFLSKPPLVRLLYSTGLHNRALNDLYMKNLTVIYCLYSVLCVLFVNSFKICFNVALIFKLHDCDCTTASWTLSFSYTFW